jgi:hypothetical protein
VSHNRVSNKFHFSLAISRIRPVITERAVLRYCGKFTLATLSVMTGLIRDITETRMSRTPCENACFAVVVEITRYPLLNYPNWRAG